MDGMQSRDRLTHASFQVLLALADQDRHGYGIMQEVQARTDGRVRLGPGTLYGAIKRLRQQGLIAERQRPADGGEFEDGKTEDGRVDERRRYYHLTARGRTAATREAERLQRLVETAHIKNLIRAPGLP